jgi:hypothetical protein
MLAWKRYVSWETRPTVDESEARLAAATSTPSIVTRPSPGSYRRATR